MSAVVTFVFFSVQSGGENARFADVSVKRKRFDDHEMANSTTWTSSGGVKVESYRPYLVDYRQRPQTSTLPTGAR